MTREFKNRFKGAKCDKCGLEIAVGAPMAWSRRADQPSRKWHKACAPTENETEQETDGVTVQSATAVNGHANGANGNGWMDGLASAIAPYLESRIAQKLDRDEVEDIVSAMLDGAVLLTATTVQVRNASTGETKDLGLQHELFPNLFSFCGAGMNVWLTGPAGSGKTTAAEKVADALNLKYYHVGAMDNEYKLMGFIDAHGRVVNTVFREWWENGGVICLDEIDSWLPAATLALNGALANGHCTFPDGMRKRNPDCIVIACANTWGHGATNDYVGRMKHDAAFIDRFIQFDWPYDEAFELALSGNADWARRVQRLRANARSKGLKVIISPRATINGAKMLARGIPQDLVEQVTVKKGMTAEQWGSIQ